jgi:hypothetical protein
VSDLLLGLFRHSAYLNFPLVIGWNDSALRTLARVLVNLDEGEYTEEVRQDTVLEHDVSPDQASEASTREDK